MARDCRPRAGVAVVESGNSLRAEVAGEGAPGAGVSGQVNMVPTAVHGLCGRPGCGAQPGLGHVMSVPLVEAARNGELRAGPQCRPYRMGQHLSWRPPGLVAQALSLILHGMLDGGTESELAGRLGVSARHLRRLFLVYLGATPDQLARFRRVQFACSLLNDTDLPVTEVAFAAGYGSLRQLNRSFRQVFGAPPSQFRAKQRVADGLVPAGGLKLRLSYHGQLDWAALVHCLAAQAIPGVEQVSACGYRRSVLIDGDPGVVELRPGEPHFLILVAYLPHWEGLIHIVGRVRHIADLDNDPDTAERLMAPDPLVGPLVSARPGVRVPGCWDPFEVGVRAIIGQHELAAATSTQRLVCRLGKSVPGLRPFGLTHCFPSAETVASAGTSELVSLGLGSAADTITRFAGALASGRLDLDRSAGLDRLISSLTAIRGLGTRCAHYIALRLGEPDAFPAFDLAVRRAFTATSLLGPIDTPSCGWRLWRALAATHLWLADQLPPTLAGEPGPPPGGGSEYGTVTALLTTPRGSRSFPGG